MHGSHGRRALPFRFGKLTRISRGKSVERLPAAGKERYCVGKSFEHGTAPKGSTMHHAGTDRCH